MVLFGISHYAWCLLHVQAKSHKAFWSEGGREGLGTLLHTVRHSCPQFSPALCCRSLTYDSDCCHLVPNPNLAPLLELTYLRVCYHEEGSVLHQLESLTKLKELSILNTAGYHHEMPVPSGAQVTKLALMGLLVSFKFCLHTQIETCTRAPWCCSYSMPW